MELELFPEAELLLEEEELRPAAVLLEAEPPEVLLLPPEELLLFEAVTLLPPEEDLLREAVDRPDVALLSFTEVPLAEEPPELLPVDDEVLDAVLLLALPLPDAVEDLDAVLELVPLLPDSLLELLSLGVPPVERFVAVLLFEPVERLPDAVVRPPAPEEERPVEPDVERLLEPDVERPLEVPERPLVELFWPDVFVDCD